MSLPGQARVVAALEATWPDAGRIERDGWCVRNGRGGGQRVAAITPLSGNGGDIAEAEAIASGLGQPPIFMLQPGDEALDAALAARGYVRHDPVVLYAAPNDGFRLPAEGVPVVHCWPHLAIQERLWDENGINRQRLAVMERSDRPRAAFLARIGNRPAGVAYAAADGNVAMIHAIAVPGDQRRRGVGAAIMCAAARWAQDMDAQWLTLAVTQDNLAARGLYDKLGMLVVGQYHYRRRPEQD